MDGKQLAEKFIERIEESTAVPTIRLDIEKTAPGLYDSKIGGKFYVPRGMEPPVSAVSNEPLSLLAQINFADMPRLDDFPEKGLLQIFIGQDEVYGCSFDKEDKQANWRIRYIEDVPNGTVDDDTVYKPALKDTVYMPFDENVEYALVPHLVKQGVNPCDYRFDELAAKYCSDLIPDGCENWGDFDDEVSEEIWDTLGAFDCQIGGWAYFTQDDPREYTDGGKDYDTILFQLDSVEDIMWGDCGIANFFITREDLKKKDFSRVWYNWDCC